MAWTNPEGAAGGGTVGAGAAGWSVGAAGWSPAGAGAVVETAPDGAFGALRRGAVFVDHTTASAGLARELEAEARRRGAGCLDAPVSGGQAGAEQGALAIMVGGEAASVERARPLLECYAKRITHLGPAGSGQLAKLVNQICIAGVIEGLAEGLHFARRAGLDPKAVVGAIAQGAAQSWQLDNRHATMLEGRYDFGFAVEWMRKDLGLALDEARRIGAALPLTALVDQLYVAVGHQRRGIGRELLESAYRLFSDAKRARLTVEADNRKGVAFYAKQGFQEVTRSSEEIIGARLENVIMERPL